MRPILIVLLVLYHAFAVYDGVWREPAGFVEVPAYSWVAKSSYAIMLEMFVFISGYLWAFQRESLGKTKSFWETVVNKFNRLIVPCLVFSALYLILFDQSNQLNISVLGVMGGGRTPMVLANAVLVFCAGVCYHTYKNKTDCQTDNTLRFGCLVDTSASI